MADWAVDSNEAVTLSLVRSTEDKKSLSGDENYEQFHPTFTYPIYGEDEKIYGYKDLVIDLRFASGSLAQYLSVKYLEKLPASTVDDVEKILKEFIPEDYYTDEAEFLKRVEDDATSYKPSGQLVHSYLRPSPSSKGKGKISTQLLDASSEDTIEYEVYRTTWETPGFRELHRRMQLFILLYIEGGSYINEEEDIWEFMVLYEKRKRKDTPDVATYHFMGYTSLYPFYCYPEKVRLRLSQFVILSPYQRGGHGSELYRAVYNYVLSQPNIAELTVEDPAEAFEDLRDKNDLIMLLSHEQFMQEAFGDAPSYGGGRVGGVGKGKRSGAGTASTQRGKMGPPVDKPWAEKWRKDLKIAGRQFQRLVEMLILYKMDIADPKAMRAYRIQVKERLYRFNFEILAQLDKEERHEKLEETFQRVKEDYDRILAMVR
ncbi:histone acetyltransferase type B catalytic subunit [Coprinopsis marcescibilis]|uniref:Histone acetyltransferase type B catalytic subunit n=1 Tax=Coprinopsis marcescibilis TaxID=230819 RepID=A0A5C3L3L3_COPMA|nr:histone acetyltransferase type B catalytic subunit [Coprinopsis marcescibilis]